jgi:hypothetical protein
VNEDVYRDTTLEGQQVYGAYARAPMSRWIAGVAVPAAVVDAAFQRSLFVVSVFGVVLLMVGFGGAFEISRRIFARHRAGGNGGRSYCPRPSGRSRVVAGL